MTPDVWAGLRDGVLHLSIAIAVSAAYSSLALRLFFWMSKRWPDASASRLLFLVFLPWYLIGLLGLFDIRFEMFEMFEIFDRETPRGSTYTGTLVATWVVAPVFGLLIAALVSSVQRQRAAERTSATDATRSEGT
jgi:hypothetical protein